MHTAIPALLVGSMVGMVLLGHQAQAGVVAPAVGYGGQSQYAWSAQWWTVFLQAEAAGNPLLSSSPGSSLAAVNSPDRAVFFLTGSADGLPIRRTVTIRSDQAIFFPVFNYAETDPNVADECGFATALIGSATTNTAYARLDGVNLVPDVLAHRQSCSTQPGTPPGGFSLAIEPGDFYYSPPVYPSGTYAAAADGYWLMVEPLSVGSYELSFGGSFSIPGAGTFTQDNIYHLQVEKVPAPLPLLGAASALALRRRLRRRTKGPEPTLKAPAVDVRPDALEIRHSA